MDADALSATPAARAALEALRAAAGAHGPMERHCLRHFAIAERLAGDRAFDRELLLCTSWLHDAGLHTPSRDPYVTEGARLAARVLAPFGWPPERLQRCMDACEQHHAPRSRMAMGLEVELVRQADLVDVTRGIVNFGLDRRWLGALFRDVPRDGFWRLVGKSFRSELSHRPASLIGVFVSPRRTHVPTLPGPEIFLGGRGFILTGRDSPGKPGREHALWPFETSMPSVFAAGDIRHGSVKRVAVRLVRNLSPSARFINTSPRCRVKAAAPCNPRSIRGLQRSRPQVDWVRGQRYVQDGTITTTAGVTSGVFGALRLVRQLAGTAEAQRVGGELAYPGWSLDGPAAIPAQRPAPRDLTNLLAALAPWRRPTVGVGLAEGIGELDVAAPFEVYATSFAARTVPIAAGRTVTTRHGLRLIAAPHATAPRVDRLIVPGARNLDEAGPRLAGWAAGRGLSVELLQADGEFSFDAMLRDLAAHAGRATAKSIEYPTGHLRLAGPAWPWRPATVLALTGAAAIAAGFLPAAAIHRNRR